MAEITNAQFSELSAKIEGLTKAQRENASIDRKKELQAQGLSKKEIMARLKAEQDRQKFLKASSQTSEESLNNILMGILGHGTKAMDPGMKIKDGTRVIAETASDEITRRKKGMFGRWFGKEFDSVVKIWPHQWDMLLDGLGIKGPAKRGGIMGWLSRRAGGSDTQAGRLLGQGEKMSGQDMGLGGWLGAKFANSFLAKKVGDDGKGGSVGGGKKVLITPEVILKGKGSKLLTFLSHAYVDGLQVTETLTKVLQGIMDSLVATMKDIGKEFLKSSSILALSLVMLGGALVVFGTGMAFMIPVTFLSILKFLTVAAGLVLISKMNTDLKGIVSLALGFALIGLGLMVFNPQMKAWEDISWSSISKFLAFSLGLSVVLFLVGSFGAGTVALGAIQLALSFALIGLSLILFTPEFKKLDDAMSWQGIGKFLVFTLGFTAVLMLAGMAFPFVMVGAFQLAVGFALIGLSLIPLSWGLSKFMKLDEKKLWKSLKFLSVLSLLVAFMGPLMFFGGGLFAVGSLFFTFGLFLLAEGFKRVNKPFMEFTEVLKAFGESIKSFIENTITGLSNSLDKMMKTIDKVKSWISGDITPEQAQDQIRANRKTFELLKEIGLSKAESDLVKYRSNSSIAAINSAGRMLAALLGGRSAEEWGQKSFGWGEGKLTGASFFDLVKYSGKNYDKINFPTQMNKIASIMNGIKATTTGSKMPSLAPTGGGSGYKGETQESLLGDIRAVLAKALGSQMETARNTRKGPAPAKSMVPADYNFQLQT